MDKILNKINMKRLFLTLTIITLITELFSIACTGHPFLHQAFATEFEVAGVKKNFGVIDKFCETLPFSLFVDIMNTGTDPGLLDALTLSDVLGNNGGGGSGGGSALGDNIGYVMNAVKGIGAAVLVLFFLMELMDKATKSQMDMENIIRMLIKYIAAKMIIIDNSQEIVKAMCSFGTAFSLIFVNNGDAGSFDGVLNNFANYLQSAGIVECFAVTVVVLVPWLLSRVVGLVIKACCYGRAIDMIVRGGLIPIGCASMVQEGFSGHGSRYLKRFFGSVIQGGIIILILRIGSMIQAAVVNTSTSMSVATIGSFLMTSLVVGFTEIMTILKSSQIANEVAGV